MNDKRKQRAGFSDAAATQDRLPPHSPEGEQGVLGCVLLSPADCMEECVKRLKPGSAVFYDERHKLIFEVFAELYGSPEAIDIITVQARLTDRKRLEEVGGLAYLTSLPDTVPSAANLTYYLDIVLEKYAMRLIVNTCTNVRAQVYEFEGPAKELLDRVDRDLARLTETNRNFLGDQMAPQFLKQPNEFAEGAYDHLFREPSKGEPGLELPIGFPLRIRRKEATLVAASDKSGKSTLLSYFALHLAAQEPGVCIASFEEPPRDSLWRLAAQLLGQKHLPDTPTKRGEAASAMAWLNKRFWFYDFLGISDWRDVLDTFRYAAEKHGVWLFVLDSVMRIGIADDDYAQQGFAATAFANFAMKNNSHLFFVMHENKSDAKAKGRIRGSALWSANASNILQLERNQEKVEKVEKVEWQIRNERNQTTPDFEDIKEKEAALGKLRKDWDTRMVLRGQRLMGSNQNAAKRFWFDGGSAQFRDRWEDLPVNWLARWKGTNRTNRTEATHEA